MNTKAEDLSRYFSSFILLQEKSLNKSLRIIGPISRLFLRPYKSVFGIRRERERQPIATADTELYKYIAFIILYCFCYECVEGYLQK